MQLNDDYDDADDDDDDDDDDEDEDDDDDDDDGGDEYDEVCDDDDDDDDDADVGMWGDVLGGGADGHFAVVDRVCWICLACSRCPWGERSRLTKQRRCRT